MAESPNSVPTMPVSLSPRPDWSLLTNTDEDFEIWRQCIKCHRPHNVPKALPCLHTICGHCLRIHYDTVKLQVQTQMKQKPSRYHFYSWEGCFPCPMCNYPCYTLSDGLPTLPTNRRLIRLAYKERFMCMFEHMSRQMYQPVLDKLDKKGKKSKKGSQKRASESPKCKGKQSTSSDDANFTGRPISRSSVGSSSMDHESLVGSEDPFSRESPKKEKCDALVKRSDSLGGHSIPPVLLPPRVANSEIAQMITTELQGPNKNAKISEIFTLHWNQLFRECSGHDEEQLIFPEEDPPLKGHRDAEMIHEYRIEHGERDFDVYRPNAIAVNPHTGHMVVVDITWNKAVLYKTYNKPFGVKKFYHPIIDVCFYPFTEDDHTEKFCAMGRSADRRGIMVYVAPFNKNVADFKCMYQRNIRDVTGVLVVEPDVLFLSLSYANTVIRQLNETQFVDLATRTHNGIYYPTHLTQTVVGEIVVADTGNHRFGVFYGPEYLAFDYYSEYGSDYGKLFYPLGLAADKDRRLYICDANNYRVQVFNRFFQFESCPIKRTYLMSKSVTQDVKPIDCAIDNKQKLVVLFRGRCFFSIQVFQYFVPQVSIDGTAEDIIAVSVPEPSSCWCCYLCCASCCCGDDERDRPPRHEYEPIQ